MALVQPITDGVVALRAPAEGDAATLIAGRDEVFHRFMGEGSPQPQPTACITVDDDVVGWVDFDVDRAWLEPGEVNLGYNVFAAHRGRGLASRAVQLLMHHLSRSTTHERATLLIAPDNERSLALATRLGFARCGALDANLYFKRAVPPTIYEDGVVRIRPQTPEDLDADLEAKDDAQIDWLWLPGQRELWEAMSPDEQRAHARRGLQSNQASFGRGPKWTFAVDAIGGSDYVAYVDCDLGNERVPAGDANISYSAHPAHRGRGYVSRAVRLVVQFLAGNTAAREVHVLVDERNVDSLRVAAAVGALERERFVDEHGATMVRSVLSIRRETVDGLG